MCIKHCPKLELKFRKQEELAVIIDQVEEQEESAVIQPIPNLSHSTTELFLPCLKSLTLDYCDSISEHLNLPSTLTYISIQGCRNIEILSGQLDALQELAICGCDRFRSLESCSRELPSLKFVSLEYCLCLVAIPNGPQAYTSLQSLRIENCPGIKSLPRCLQQRLKSLDWKYIDSRFEGPRLSKPKTWKYAISRDW